MKMKQLWFVILLGLLGLSVITQVYAQNGTLFIGDAPGLPATYTVTQGDIITIPIQINGLSPNIAGVMFKLQFDPSLVQLVDINGNPATTIETTNIFGSGVVTSGITVDISNGVVNFNVRSLSPLTNEGIIAILRWQGQAVGTSALTFSEPSWLDGLGNSVGVPTLSGSEINVAPTPTPTPTLTPTATLPPTITPTPTATSTPTFPPTATFTPTPRPTLTPTPTYAPGLQITPDRLSYVAAMGDNDPAPQGIVINNSGLGILNWVATVSDNWLSLSLEKGTIEPSGTVVIYARVNLTGLAMGTYNGEITIKGNGNLQKVIAVTLELEPSLTTVPTALNFESLAGAVDPAAQIVTITRHGAGTVNWSATSDSDWLSVDPSHATATTNTPSKLNARVNIINLPVGTYNGTITIKGDGADSSSQTIAVTLTIYADSRPTVTPLNVSGRVTLQGSNPDYSGVKVYLSPNSCATFNARETNEPEKAITTGNGDFTIPADGQCLQVVKAGYLMGQVSSPSRNIGTIKLLAGDVVPNDEVDIFDMAYLGSQYGNVQADVADFDRDGDIDIFDITLAAGNFRQRGPLTNWE